MAMFVSIAQRAPPLATCLPSSQVVRLKDRFVAAPSAGGWRDLMINFVVVGDKLQHVCELQIVHEMMLTARKGLPGHEIYNIVRNASELMESSGQERELLGRLEAKAVGDFALGRVAKCSGDLKMCAQADYRRLLHHAGATRATS